MPQKRKLVYLGMSGGVDSSVSAALLLRAGYEVVGVFIRVWEPPGYKCTWRDDRREAMRVAAALNIPLLTLDLEAEYKRDVVDYMIKEYQSGRTPNPDVMCNKTIKFGAFYNWARKRGADLVATGHYAQVLDGKLAVSKDQNKDQTYFLWNLRGEQLDHVIFPIGHLTKPEVRTLAKKFNLPNAEKRDSQGLCFIGQIDLKEFLGRYLKLQAGQVLNEQGEVIGEHDGAVLYTVGERHGFKVKPNSPEQQPYFVTERNLKANTITVGQSVTQTTTQKVFLEKSNWISEPPKEGKKYLARIRHRGELYPCQLKINQSKVEVVFLKPPLAPAAGQSLVIYESGRVLGGGVIA
jgi:tRNA-specific 2-thiouridylase